MPKEKRGKNQEREDFVFYFLLYFITGVLLHGFYFGKHCKFVLWEWKYAGLVWMWIVIISGIFSLNRSKIWKIFNNCEPWSWKSWIFGKNKKWFWFFIVLWILLIFAIVVNLKEK